MDMRRVLVSLTLVKWTSLERAASIWRNRRKIDENKGRWTSSNWELLSPLWNVTRGYVKRWTIWSMLYITTACLSSRSYPFSLLSPSKLILSAMAAPAPYIRTIHTSFTAAYPHSSTAWANAAAVRSPHHTLSASINSHNSQIYQQHLQQQHNNFQQHQKNQQQLHHLQARKSTTSLSGGSVPSPAGAGGRRRAASIRMAPSPTPSPSPYMKFDPFADEPVLAPLVPSSQVNRISYVPNPTYSNRDYQRQPPSISSGSESASPITIHIPAAAPTEIKRYSTSTSPNRRITNFTSNPTSSSGSTGSTFLGGSTIPTLNPSKIVAGILLNRVHAVGKPMRRRMPVVSGPKQYVKSGLSSVVSVEAWQSGLLAISCVSLSSTSRTSHHRYHLEKKLHLSPPSFLVSLTALYFTIARTFFHDFHSLPLSWYAACCNSLSVPSFMRIYLTPNSRSQTKLNL